jgi:predicted alpha/beta superfamily hydrolase
MKKLILTFLIIILSYPSFYPQKDVSVTFNVEVDSLHWDSNIYVTGNHIKLGNWQPDVVKLSKSETGENSKSISFKYGEMIEFKITRGNWDTEALNVDGSTPGNFTLTVKNDTTINIQIKLWADQVERIIEGQITGTVRYHKNFESKNLKPRDIIVWLPPFYFSEKEMRYPVLYMHDGQNIIDPRTSSFNIDWQIDESADTLIRKEYIDPIIIVGIYNTQDRSEEYSEDSLGYVYMKFIIDSLKPFIDKNYRTLDDRENTATGGSSSGGLISFILPWEYPTVFSKSACISPAFKIDKYDFVNNVVSDKGEKKKLKFYIDNGNDALDTKLQPGVDEMLNALIEKGFLEKQDYYFFKDLDGSHNESSWSKRFWRALIFMFGTVKGKSLL